MAVATARLRSSFIYLANAVNDLSRDWVVLAMVLAPLILLASLCLLPDALNLQHRVAHTFESSAGLHSVGLHQISLRSVQIPYRNIADPPPVDPYPDWMTRTLHLVFLFISLMVSLVVLCGLSREETGQRAPTATGEAIQIYRRVLRTAPAFLWLLLLQLIVIAVACAGFMVPLLALHLLFFGTIAVDPYIVIPLIIPGLLAVTVLYFSKVALIFDGVRSWPALLHSRELERGRFVKVAMRILVFSAVWSGYNSWASGAFLVASILLGPVGAVTGYVWSMVFLLDLLSVTVAYFTTAFFVAASVRLYQDLTALRQDQMVVVNPASLQRTAPLPNAAASAR